MKLVQYLADGKSLIGVLTDRGVVEIAGDPAAPASMDDALAPAGLAAIHTLLGRPNLRILSEDLFRYLPPLCPTARIFCVGLNYRDHVEETGRAQPVNPSIFLRTHQSMSGHNETIIKPIESEQMDFECEVAVLIGTAGRRIAVDKALPHIGGYTCCNEGSIRDYQQYSVTAGKNFDSSGALGPCVVTADEVPDPATLTVATRVNGIEMQHSRLDQLIFSIPAIVSYISRFTELLPGDVISTGTPAGIGSRRSPPVWLREGDVLEIDVSAVGTLRTTVGISDDCVP